MSISFRRVIDSSGTTAGSWDLVTIDDKSEEVLIELVAFGALRFPSTKETVEHVLTHIQPRPGWIVFPAHGGDVEIDFDQFRRAEFGDAPGFPDWLSGRHKLGSATSRWDGVVVDKKNRIDNGRGRAKEQRPCFHVKFFTTRDKIEVERSRSRRRAPA